MLSRKIETYNGNSSSIEQTAKLSAHEKLLFQSQSSDRLLISWHIGIRYRTRISYLCLLTKPQNMQTTGLVETAVIFDCFSEKAGFMAKHDQSLPQFLSESCPSDFEIVKLSFSNRQEPFKWQNLARCNVHSNQMSDEALDDRLKIASLF